MIVIPLTLEDVKHARKGYFVLYTSISHEMTPKSTRNQTRNPYTIRAATSVLLFVPKQAKSKAKSYEIPHYIRISAIGFWKPIGRTTEEFRKAKPHFRAVFVKIYYIFGTCLPENSFFEGFNPVSGKLFGTSHEGIRSKTIVEASTIPSKVQFLKIKEGEGRAVAFRL